MTEQFDFLWNKIRERAKALINPISYSTFIENLVPVDVIGKKIAHRAERELAARTITKNHLEKLREAVVSADVGLTDAIIVVEGSEEFTLNESPDDVVEADSVVLDKRYTFESYVVGSSNKFVFAAVFPLGLILTVICGADLFTGNAMTLTSARINNRVDWLAVLRSWTFAWLGNFIGALFVAYFLVWATGIKLPGSIIGMLLLAAFLQAGWVKLRWVKGISDFLVSNMGFFFVPPGVALMLYFDVIAAEFWPIVTATVVSTVLVLVVTGHVHQWVRKHGVFRK